MRETKNSGIVWIGDIPAHWQVTPHKYVMHKDKSICESYKGEDIISLTMNGVIVRDLMAGGKMPTSFDGYQYVDPEDLLLCLFDIDVTPRCVGVVRNHGVTSPAYSRFKVYEGYYNTYYDYLLRFIDDEKVFIHLAKNLRSSLTETDFGAIKTVVPPYEEQKRIAKLLDRQCAEFDAVIEKTKATIEEYKKLKQSIITEAVTKGIRQNRPMKDSGIEWIGEIPTEWNICKSLYALAMPITDGPHTTPDLFDKGIPFVSAEAVSCGNGKIDFNHIRGYISEEFYNECCLKYTPQVNDIYMIKSGATTGRVAYVDTDIKFNIWSPLAVFRANEERTYFKYLFYYLQSDAYQKEVQLGWTYGTQQNIGMRTLEALKVLLPSIEEQKEIANHLDKKCAEIDAIIAKKTDLLEEMESYKKSMIYEYVTGKKEVLN